MQLWAQRSQMMYYVAWLYRIISDIYICKANGSASSSSCIWLFTIVFLSTFILGQCGFTWQFQQSFASIGCKIQSDFSSTASQVRKSKNSSFILVNSSKSFVYKLQLPPDSSYCAHCPLSLGLSFLRTKKVRRQMVLMYLNPQNQKQKQLDAYWIIFHYKMM